MKSLKIFQQMICTPFGLISTIDEIGGASERLPRSYTLINTIPTNQTMKLNRFFILKKGSDRPPYNQTGILKHGNVTNEVSVVEVSAARYEIPMATKRSSNSN